MSLPQLKIQATLRQRSMFAVQHLMAAARFSRQCGDVEEVNAGMTLGPFYDEQISCVSATIMLCVASLESNIKEYLSDADELFSEIPDGAREQHCKRMSGLSILEKYERVLSAKQIEPFARGRAPYQNIDLLIAIRNELVHFHPEWHDSQKRHEKPGRRILQARFPLSPFIDENSGVTFPQRMVSHGCTNWAVASALTFMEMFATKLGQTSRFSKHTDKLLG